VKNFQKQHLIFVYLHIVRINHTGDESILKKSKKKSRNKYFRFQGIPSESLFSPFVFHQHGSITNNYYNWVLIRIVIVKTV